VHDFERVVINRPSPFSNENTYSRMSATFASQFSVVLENVSKKNHFNETSTALTHRVKICVLRSRGTLKAIFLAILCQEGEC
jgi:hypothetical protein